MLQNCSQVSRVVLRRRKIRTKNPLVIFPRTWFTTHLPAPPSTHPQHEDDSDNPSSTAVAAASGERGLLRLLTDRQRSLLAEQRAVVSWARRTAQRATGSMMSPRKTAVQPSRVDGPTLLPPPFLPLDGSGAADDESSSSFSSFCVVVAGEFNSGKSTLINALLGNSELLPMGSLPTTDRVTFLGSPDEPWMKADPSSPSATSSFQTISVPGSLLLEDLTLVDTPGTNADGRHTADTLHVLPQADWILWVTSADRPLPESERLLLRQLADYKPRLAIVVNKVDVLYASGGDHGRDQLEQVLDYVRTHAADALGHTDTPVLAVSARDALAAQVLHSRGGVWKRSGWSELEDFLARTLTNRTKIQSKLAGPLGGVAKSMQECQQLVEVEQADLQQDVATLRLLDVHLEGWRSALNGELQSKHLELLDVLDQEGQRCWLLLRRLRWHGLIVIAAIDRRQLELEWDRTRPVARHETATLRQHLLEKVRDMADAAAVQGRVQGQAVIEFLGTRPSVKHRSLVGSVLAASRFEDTRHTLTAQLSQAVERVLSEHAVDHGEPRRLVLNQLQTACRVATGLAATSVAALVASAVQWVDLTIGIEVFAASSLGSVGALSSVRWRTALSYQQRWVRARNDLKGAVEGISTKEVERIAQRVQDGIVPYRHFVQAEQARLQEQADECQDVLLAAQELRSRIETLE